LQQYKKTSENDVILGGFGMLGGTFASVVHQLTAAHACGQGVTTSMDVLSG
jgi:hypothetical protein